MSGIDKSNVSAILPLLPLQEGLLFHHISDPQSPIYFEQLRLNVSGTLDIDKLQMAWNRVIQNNESLRTVFRWNGIDKPVQIVLKEHALNIEFVASSQVTQNTLGVLRSPSHLDLQTNPISLCVVEQAASTFTIVLSFHHILLDGWSSAIIIKSLLDAYKDNDIELEVSAATKDIHQAWKNADRQATIDWWADASHQCEVNNALPHKTIHLSNPTSKAVSDNKLVLPINSDLQRNMEQLCEKEGLTLATLFHAAFSVCLQQYQNQNQLTFGTTVSGRGLPINNIAHTTGLFINTLPFCAEISVNTPFVQWAKQVQLQLANINQHSTISLKEIQKLSPVPDDEMMFDSLLVVENYPIDTRIAEDTGFTIDSLETTEETNFDLTLAITQLNGLECNLLTKADRFAPSFGHAFLAHFQTILEKVTSSPQALLQDLSLVQAASRQHDVIRTEYNSDLVSQFKQSVERYPNRTAVSNDVKSLSYKELDSNSDKIAAALSGKGIGNGDIVGIRLPRDICLIEAIWGVLKAGASYLPLLPDLPTMRAEFMIQDTGAKLCIVDGEQSQANCQFYVDFKALLESELTVPEINLDSKDTAYIIYSSGSTGTPKGILTPHGAVAGFAASPTYVDISEKDRVLQLSSYGFDGSVFDIFTTHANGAELVLVSEEVLSNLDKLTNYIEERDITLFFVTTALFNAIVDTNVESLQQVKNILFGGEKVSVQHVKKAFRELGPGRLTHVYGPTETTVFATAYNIKTTELINGSIPIGSAINDSQCYVLDRNQLPCLPGVAGELYISGPALATGYLNRNELTNESFVSLPGIEQVTYRTGDEVVATEEGLLTYQSRLDSQVKIRGLRIELGEIVSRLIEVSDASDVYVTVKGNESGNGYIVAYLVQEQTPNKEDLTRQLSAFLPRYMLPQHYIQLDCLPLTANNKVDARALPEPVIHKSTVGAQPATDREKLILSIWQKVLEQPQLTVTDDVFDFGANSIAISRVSAQMQKHLSKKLEIKALFSTTNVRAQSRLIDELGATSQEQTIPRQPSLVSVKATPIQRGLFTQTQMQPSSTAYNMPLAFTLQGNFKTDEIATTLERIVSRHPVLFSSFDYEGEELVATSKPSSIQAHLYNSSLSVDQCLDDFIQPFDLNAGQLVRLALQNFEDKHHIYIDVHHIVADGIAIGVLIDEFLSELEGVVNHSDDSQVLFADYAAWLSNDANKDAIKEQEEFWANTLQHAPQRLDLFTDYSRPQTRTFEGAQVNFKLDKETSLKLDNYTHTKISVNTVLFTAFHLVLSKYSQQSDFCTSILSTGRTHHQLQDMVGMFNNFLPVPFVCYKNQSLKELLEEQQERLVNALQNQDYPYHNMVSKWSQSEPGRNPFFDTMFILHNQLSSADGIKTDNFSLEKINTRSSYAKLDLKLDVYPTSDQSYSAVLEFSTELFKRETIESLATHFKSVLDQILNDSTALVQDLTLVTHQEQQQILSDFNDTKTESSSEQSLIARFEQIVESKTDEIAISTQHQRVTWAEFNKKVNKLAHYLRNEGIGPESIVALQIPRSIDMMIAIFATTKAGGAWLPIQVSNPSQRTLYILKDSNAALHLHCGAPLEEPICPSIDLTSLDTSSFSDINPQSLHSADNLAYVIYTSGSTGEPKGVLIEHGALVNRLDWMQTNYPLFSSDTVLQKTPYTFDVSVWELIWWSFTGSKLFLIGQGEEKDPSIIAETICEQNITCMHFVPSMLTEFLYTISESDSINLNSLKQVFTSGEALTHTQAFDFNCQIHASTGATLHNLYGPTEATIDVSYYDCISSKLPSVIPIGKPIDNTTLVVLDQHLQLCPVGVPGELYIGGANLARGYLNKDTLTRKSFIPNPFGPGRLYKTGDRAKWLESGNISYLGRLDHQVKIRGQRIETGEIEHALAELTQAVHVGTYTDANNEMQLAAWYVETSEHETSAQCFREHLLKSLPSYMVPLAFVRLDCFPLTANGKLDRKALPAPQVVSTYVAPSTPTENKLAELYESVLKLDNVGREDNFFLIGGQSLSATRLMTQVRQEWKIALPLSDIFSHPILKDLASKIDQHTNVAISPIEKQPAKEHKVLSFGQQRMWLVDKIDHAKGRYNIHTRLVLKGKLDVDALKLALQRTIQRHDILRTTYQESQGNVIPALREAELFEMVTSDQCLLSQHSLNEHLAQLSEEESSHTFDLKAEFPLRTHLIKVAEDTYALLLTMHHIASDGWSLGVLTQEIGRHYRDVSLGNKTSIEPLPIQYSDYAHWQRDFEISEDFIQQKDFWLSSLDGIPESHSLTLDLPRSSVQAFESGRHTQLISKPIRDAIHTYAQASGCTVFMVLQTAFSLLISKYSNEADVVIGTPIANREQADVENLIGFFVNTLVLRSNIDGSRTFAEQLEYNKAFLLKAYANQQYPFEKLVDELSPSRNLSHHPLFQIMMVMQNQDISFDETDELTISVDDVMPTTAKFDLTLDIAETEDVLRIHWDFAASLFTQQTIENMADNFEWLLRSVLSTPNLPQSSVSLMESSAQVEQAIRLRQSCTTHSICKDSIVDRFNAISKRFPNSIAVSYQGTTLSYVELNKLANQLANQLVDLGVKKDDKIALVAEPGLNMIVSILAILKTGSAYVPVDPLAPSDRIEHILTDSQTSLLVAATELELPELSIPVVDLNNIDVVSKFASQSTSFSSDINVGQTAYIIYTSGSTGLPKGVQVTHDNVVRLFDSTEQNFQFNENDVWTLFHSFAFDFSVWEIWGALLNGAKLVIVPPMVTRSPSEFLKLLSTEKVTVLNQTPSAFYQLIDADAKEDKPLDLRLVIFGGEALTLGALSPWIERHSIEKTALVNMYGITETTVHVTYKALSENDIFNAKQSLIGLPINDLYVYILDENKSIQPNGVPGEMYVGGAGVSKGYLNRPDLNQSRFIPDPYHPENTLYRTGDRARQTDTGELEYLGRLDEQVKIRGFRIELGEIQHQLLSISGVSEAIVLVNDQSLSAFVVSSTPRTRQEYKHLLEQSLPAYMLPSSFTEVSSIPLTINGKADKRKLIELESTVVSGAEYVDAETDTERQLSNIWQDVLNTTSVSVEDSFFDIGANSLLIVKAHNLIEAAFPSTVRVTDLFSHTSIRELASFIDSNANIVMLPATDLPVSYFNKATGRSIQTLRTTYPSATFERLLSAFDERSVSLLSGQTGIVAYLIAQINKKHNVNFNVANEKGKILPFSMDLSAIQSIDALIIQANAEIEKFAHFESKTDLVIPSQSQAQILIKGERTSIKSEQANQFDLVLSLPEDSKKLSVSLSFDSGRFNKNALNAFLSGYFKLVSYSIEQLSEVSSVE